MILLEENLRIRPEQTKTNLVFEMEAPRDFEKIVIDAEYAPKFVTGERELQRLILAGGLKWDLLPPSAKTVKTESWPAISNQLALSLDINGTLCGYAHRQDPKQRLVISAGYATPGFHPSKPEKGLWRLMIQVFLAAGEIRCHIRVSGLGEGEAQ